MEVDVRPIAPADEVEVRAILASLADEVIDVRGGSLFVAEQRRLAAGAKPLTGLVGTIDCVIVGVAILETQALDIGSVGVVQAFGVLPDARGVGVGAGLFDAAVEQFRALGCVGVDVTALPGARATKNFFEGLGFTARSLLLHKPLAHKPLPSG